MILFDLPVYRFIMSIFPVSMSMTAIMKMITTLGSSIVIVAGLISIAVLIRDKKYFKIFVLATLLSSVINNILKLIVHRPRPSQTMVLAAETTYSFPSGHSMVSMVFYGLIIYYIRKFVKEKWLSNLLTIVLSLVILAVGITRIYLGVHYSTDVLAAYVFGFVYLFVFVKVLKKRENKYIQHR